LYYFYLLLLRSKLLLDLLGNTFNSLLGIVDNTGSGVISLSGLTGGSIVSVTSGGISISCFLDCER